MACGCSKNRTAAAGSAAVAGTYRVMVNGRKVYETGNETAARTVADKYRGATILAPGQNG